MLDSIATIHTVRRKPFVIALSVIAFVLILLFIIPRPTSPVSLLLAPPPSPETNSKQQLINQLPHQTPNYKLEYFPLLDHFYLSIYTKPYETNINQAHEFIRQYSLDPSSLNLTIGYFDRRP